MSNRTRIPSLDDHYCQVCSTASSSTEKRLSCFSCEHCRLSMCYECFEKHTNQLIDEYNQLQARFSQLNNLFDQKRQFLATFQEHCVQNVNATFDEILLDVETLRQESIRYVQQQFNDAEISISDLVSRVQPMMTQSQQQWSQTGISEKAMAEVETQRKQIREIEHRMEIFSSPHMHIKMSTYPRNKLDLYCQLLTSSYSPTKKFSFHYPGRAIATRCTYRRGTDLENEKIEVENEVEEFTTNLFSTKHVQTEPPVDPNADSDEENEPTDSQEQAGDRLTRENCLSARPVHQGTILTQNEVDRIASDGEHLLYFSDTSKSLCYITNFLSTKQANGVSMTQEISCRWPHHPILDMTYSPTSSQFICATKNGIYTVTIKNGSIDFNLQLTQLCTYVRVAADKNFIWLWTDTPRSNQLRTYSPRTFTCVKIFNLNDYPRFSDNSTSFCIHGNMLATLFQFKQASNANSYRKLFHLTFCNSADLRESCTIRLGACEIDHEIRVNQDGLFFVTNGKKKLWIVDQKGKKEYVKLSRPGRALTMHQSNRIIIANGTQQLQSVELS